MQHLDDLIFQPFGYFFAVPHAGDDVMELARDPRPFVNVMI